MVLKLGEWLEKLTGLSIADMPATDGKSIKADDEREWLVTNGLGSYASSSISGANTRRYHGLFVASLNPPTSRTALFSRIDEYVNGENISTNFWEPDLIEPKGFKRILTFTFYPCPTWVYDMPDGYLIKQVIMLPEKQDSYIHYFWESKPEKNQPVKLDLHVLLNHRDFHGDTHADDSWKFQQEFSNGKLKARAFDGATELSISFRHGEWSPAGDWYRNYYYPRENERGLGDREDLHHLGVLSTTIESGESFLVSASLEPQNVQTDAAELLRELIQYREQLIKAAGSPNHAAVRRLTLAADQFIVRRNSTQSQSIIAGYHWFNDWGRDSMIGLPGLTLATGRPDIAKSILQTFQKHLSEGMLPNNFPDSGEQPQYNTSDATLWWAWALKKYYEASGDLDFVKEALPGLESVVEHHLSGTRYNLRVDEDGLLSGGADNVQLTWMDAKVGDFVVTPRRGKAVEISALWYSFLRTLAKLKKAAGQDASRYEELAAKTKTGFQSFWNAQKNCLYDVIGEDGVKDDSVRPNQIFALSLEPDLLEPEQMKAVMKIVEAELLTPLGLRSLSPKHPSYVGKYGNGKKSADQWERDGSYHQGTVWAWLLGPWIDARMNTFGIDQENIVTVNAHLALILHHHVCFEAGLGSISEIFDGDSPHKAAGCIAQAWSVAELLRVFSDYPELQGLTRKELVAAI